MTRSEKSEDISDWKQFFESTPPGVQAKIRKFAFRVPQQAYSLRFETISLHCEDCSGLRNFFARMEEFRLEGRDKWHSFLINFLCQNCRTYPKQFAVQCKLPPETQGDFGYAIKIGEWPPFGPPTPARVISLIGEDRENFLKGRRCEFQGMGIGAFAYYRRVVENQKNRFLSEIIRVAQKTDATDVIASLERAKAETQFTKAIANIKPAVPDALKINTHNPLTLLHTALSDGLHDQTEEHCLELATSIRLVLFELAERIGQILKDQQELETAVSKLLNPPHKN